ncbi:protein MAIN-LIKE 1-like [Vicia villosa]|uniref:protein MAIN-LIKE 1-like n=1 Tax=Vicia villosa TaxID=3911 RepID=UPI00273BA4BB|nr:protein MAIN-LIKE 1-like [Vicia villosa]
MVNHARKVFSLFKPTAEWFNDAVRASGLSGLCMTGYSTISHGMQGAFMERWHKETSSFHLPVGDMTITLHDLLHLPIRGTLLHHSRIQRIEASEWMALYLGMEPKVADFECITTCGPHIRFTKLSTYFEHHLVAAAEAEDAGDDLFTHYHRGCALRCWYMHVEGPAIFVDKSVRYVDVTYLRYFMDLTTVHQWNWGAATLAYLYQKLNEASNWRTRQLTGSCTLLTSWIISYFSRIHGFHIDPEYDDAMPRAARYVLQRGNNAVGPYRGYLDRTMHDDVT